MGERRETVRGGHLALTRDWSRIKFEGERERETKEEEELILEVLWKLIF